MDPHPPLDEGSELGDRLDETVISLPCYEPAGNRIELTGRALCTHTLLLGQTGCGKTSVLRWFIKGLIQHRAGESEQQPGVFIFDLNGDETVALVRKWARQAGREGDLRLLTPYEGHLELFADVHHLDDLPFATSLFLYGKWAQDRDNAYWNETTRTLLDAALGICLIVTGRLNTDTVLRFVTNWLIAQRPTEEDEALLKTFELMASKATNHLDKLFLSKIEVIRATVGMWTKLDSRTKGILNSCLLSAVGGLISPGTRRYIDSSRGSCFVPETVSEGRILVFSLPAAMKLETASLLGKIIKSRLYTALQRRPQDRNQRLCAIVADEYHYLASGGSDRSSDVTALATLRSRSVALIAATQSLDHLASLMGPHDFRSLLPNFGNHFFFRSVENTTSAFAMTVMGAKAVDLTPTEEQGDLLMQLPRVRLIEAVCPPGSLAAMQSGQAYVALSTGLRSPGALWLAGNYESAEAGEPAPQPVPPSVDPWQKLRDQVRAAQGPDPAVPDNESLAEADPPPDPPLFYDAETWRSILQRGRFQRSPYLSFDEFRQAFASLNQHPAGLETLPPCWWEALVNLTRKFAHRYPMTLLGLRQEEGRLLVMLAGTAAPSGLYLRWIAQVQASLYPSRYRRLKARDERLLFPRKSGSKSVLTQEEA